MLNTDLTQVAIIDIESNIILNLSDKYRSINSMIETMAAGCSKPNIPSFLDIGDTINNLMKNIQKAEEDLMQDMNNVSFILNSAVNTLRENDQINLFDFFSDDDIGILLSGIGNSFEQNIHLSSFLLNDEMLEWYAFLIKPENYDCYTFHTRIIPIDKIKEAVEKGLLYFNPDKNLSNYVFIEQYFLLDGKRVSFLQVLNSDDNYEEGYDSNELELNNYALVNVVNTLRTLPSSFTNCIENGNNLIILASDQDLHGFNNAKIQGQEGLVLGYYLPDNNPSNIDGTIVLNTDYSVRNSTLNYLVNVAGIIHELAHKFDDSLNGVDNGFATVIGNELHEEWYNYQKEYYNKITGINAGGYSERALALEANTMEFFAEYIKLYFINGDAFEAICPPVYKAISKLLGGDYGDAYTNNINAVLGKSN